MDPKLRKTYSECVYEVERGLLSHFLNKYDVIVIDLASITYGVKNRIAFLQALSLAQTYGNFKARIILVLDYQKNGHKSIVNKLIPKIENYGLEYILSHYEPAEIKAAKICREFQEKGITCIVLSRDYDPLQIIDEMLQPIKIHTWQWILRLIKIDRKCVELKLKNVK